jgi:Spy/CpxP family protein refolding chaperone
MMKRLAIACVVVTLVPAAAFAQRRGGGVRTRSGRSAGVFWDAHSTLLLFVALFDLTTAQEQRLSAVFDAAAETASPLSTAVNAGTNALFNAVKSGQSDDQLQSLAERQGALTTQLQALQARTFAKLWALLTADQKAKVDDSIYAHIGTFLANAARPGGD